MSRNTNSYFHTLQIPMFILNEIKSLVRNLSKHSSLLYVPSPHWHLLPPQREQNLILLLPQRGALFTINLDEDTEADLSTHQGKNIRQNQGLICSMRSNCGLTRQNDKGKDTGLCCGSKKQAWDSQPHCRNDWCILCNISSKWANSVM